MKKSWISQKVKITESTIEGRGMFTREDIKEGEKVIIFGGVYTDNSGARRTEKEGEASYAMG